MQCTRTGDTAGKNLAALGDELLQRLDVFEVDVLDLLDAEFADALAAVEELLLATLLLSAGVASSAITTRATARSSSTRCHRCHRRSPYACGAVSSTAGTVISSGRSII